MALSHMRPLRGDRLMIISNGAAPAALALDALWSRNGKLATLSEETCQKLRDALPEHVAVSNPLDLRDDATKKPARNCAMHCQNMWQSLTLSICAMTPAASIMSKRWTFCSTARILMR